MRNPYKHLFLEGDAWSGRCLKCNVNLDAVVEQSCAIHDEEFGWVGSTNFGDVMRFHRKFGVPMRHEAQRLPEDEFQFRHNFMDEELTEYYQAHHAGDLAKQFDALIDLVYVALGTAIMHGFPWQEGWAVVQRANMAKVPVSATDREGRHRYDVVKPEGWTPPDLSSLCNVPKPSEGANAALRDNL